MSVRAIDENGDWIFGIGRNAYLSKNAALAQQIRCRLFSFLNDCFFDLEAGVDWPNLLGGKDPISLRLAVASSILNTPGVTGIKQLSTNLDPSTRKLSIVYEAQTVYSTTGLLNLVLPV